MTELPQDSSSDPQVSRLYRQHATGEPSASLDEQILAAARAALADQKSAAPAPAARRRGWWQRWRTPLALATTVVLSLTLTLVQDRPPGDGPPARSQPLAKKSGDDSGSVPSLGPAVSPVADEARPAAALAPSTPTEVRAKVAPTSAGVSEGDRRQQAGSAAGPLPAEASRAPATVAAPAAKLEGRVELAPGGSRGDSPASPARASTDAGVASRNEAPGVGPDAAAAAERGAVALAPAKAVAERARNPAIWLEEISALRRAGKIDDAERELRAFRLANPDYPLPGQFRQ
ncbi:hypothetical protein [Accumulibacter sp.]|uniref:hypothetical protein n=1 Tax=Accumulibacter sp. TaxID=2053492 RepID=UPI002612DB03|nr:hypothetical protein [Accumulibacter sp.]